MSKHIFVSSRGALFTHWQQAFPASQLISSVDNLSEFTTSEPSGVVWFDASGVTEVAVLDAVQVLVSFGWPIVVMLPVPSEDWSFAVLKCGAKGCCHSMASPAQLREIALVVENGGLWVGPSVLQRVLSATVKAVSQPSSNLAEELMAALTERERMVAAEVARGASNREIAERLFITERTVKAHLSVIFEKLAVRDRVELALRLNNVAVIGVPA